MTAVFDPTTPDEVWYPIPGFPGYELSSDWRVRSFRKDGRIQDSWHLIRTCRLKNGYLKLTLQKDRRQHTVYLHHVISEIAFGPRQAGISVLHRDDDKLNNFPSNLGYGTQKVNVRDGYRNGRSPLGEARSVAKLNDEQVRDIRLSAAKGESQRSIAARLGVCQQLVSGIVRGRRWSHVL